MKPFARRDSELTVIKIGGGLTRIPGALDRVCRQLAQIAETHRVVVVPGGGPFADVVRAFDAQGGLSSDAAHWMAILAMDQYAHVLADRISGAELVDEPGCVSAVAPRKVVVLAPFRWMRAADVLPHTWGVTSDSIAAFIAGALGATRLVLIKPTAQGPAADPFFKTALPAGTTCLIMEWEAIEGLAARLNE
jgi:5-(aminomethyl)-3-furanmethanol phosphate kinase